MKKLLLSFAIAFASIIYAQNGNTACSEAQALCGALGSPFVNTFNAGPAIPGPDYDCLGSQPNPFWFYIPISDAGDLYFALSQEGLQGNGIDIDFICYGPFTSLEDSCNNLNEDHVVDCSYSASAQETASITNAQVGEFYIMMVTNFSDQEGHITIDILENSTGAIDCAGINLNAFLDANANGVKDDGENDFMIGTFNYELNNDGVVHNATTPNGNYFIYEPEMVNTYDVGFNVLPLYAPYFSVTPSYYENVSTTSIETVTTYYFPVTLVEEYDDVAVYIIPVEQPQPGFEHDVILSYVNLGSSTVAAGSIDFSVESPLTITNVDETVTDLTDTGFTYNFTNLEPYETVTFPVTLSLPPDVELLGDIVTTTAIITPLTGDITPDNNTSVNSDIVVGAYDPNDKMESRGRNVLITDFDTNDYLYYTIRFQNLGTASAINVRIEDVLNEQLDNSTVEMIRSSHDYIMEQDENKLIWYFNEIMLPAAQDDEESSNGYVYFRVKPFPDFAVGDVIPNGAGIYFDFNEVVETNVFETHFVEAALNNQAFTLNNFTLYPNPTNNMVTLTLGNTTTDNMASVKVYDITGKVLFSSNAPSNATNIDVSTYTTGIYFVEVHTNKGIKHTEKLIVN
ncbi:T9SS type A sorting domain-containing protein [Flavobacterium litorale]|uniref:T9SS type A sorting domain-containing protein n=1 Tax=Flavobacterium litorale TaxID=2856519 RepID=A0ABX8V3B7_9FLAO|nr:T9SS type A sorting domain-containing protein [Flavobacterium litorale]QYJ67335.1 T9SS type A sorting domain-containing protein [Flavobacterium litorale]